MNETAKKIICQALRSGEYRQTHDKTTIAKLGPNASKEICCVGSICFWEFFRHTEGLPMSKFGFTGIDPSDLPAFRKWIGMNDKELSHFAKQTERWNFDEKLSFDEIADLIETNY